MAAPGKRGALSLGSFNPESEAEPPGIEEQQAAPDTTPTVLNKLQKWADYEAIGSPVWPTRFVPMKTPMSREILDNWSLPEAPKHPLTVPLLLAREAALGREVGLIIDLANHDCLYSDDVPDSVEYEHVQLIAKVLPSRAAIDEVERIARAFWAEHPSQFVGVHCAYGFNRTGFVVCSYLCQACGLTVEQALESFAAARPPGVKHEKFIRELYARYGTASQAPTPEGSLVLGASPPATQEVDQLALEAECLRQAAAARGEGDGEAQPVPAPAAQQQERPRQRQWPRLQPHGAAAGEEEEVPHFEDAAHSLRRRSMHRQQSAGSAASGQQQAAAPAAAAPSSAPDAAASRSQPGSGASSRCASQHGGSDAAAAAGRPARPASMQQQQQQAEEPPEEGVATTVGSAEEFAASRRLLQRKPSRSERGGAGGLSLALAGGLPRGSAGSPSSSSAAAGGSSPVSIRGTAQSSFSDFAAAAVHLEGAASMRRSTSLGLAKALCEDFLQNNGTPSTAAPISRAAAWEEEESCAAEGPPRGSTPPDRAAAAGGDGSSSGAASPSREGSRPSRDDGDAACWLGSSPSKPTGAGVLGSSPGKRGGIPPPRNSSSLAHGGQPPQLAPVRAPVAPPPGWQQPPAGWQPAAHGAPAPGPAGQPGTPHTPASSTTPSALGSSFQRSVGGGPFLRSVSIDSENPSLGFGAREALMQLRAAGAAAVEGAAPSRGSPQALEELFREDSRGEQALDVEEHLAAMALNAGIDSPVASAPLPKLIDAAAAAAAGGYSIGLPRRASAPLPGKGGNPAAEAAAAAAAAAFDTKPPPPPQPQEQRPQEQQRQPRAAAGPPSANPGSRPGQPKHRDPPCTIM